MSAEDDLRDALRRAEDALEAEMRRVGAVGTHGPTIGGGRERAVADSIRTNIPQPIVTRHGEIHAPGVGPSSEWDIILCDPHTVGSLAGVVDAVPIESVLAVVSVKSQLDSAAVAECGAAAARLRGMVLQDPSRAPLPAVFAIGLDGVQPDTLEAALAKATTDHGPFSRLDGAFVLKRHTALPTADGYCLEADEESFIRWILAIDQALQRAPRRVASLAPYLGVGEEPEEDGGEAVPVATEPRLPGGGGDFVAAEPRAVQDLGAAEPTRAPAGTLGVDISLRRRGEGQDLAASRVVARLIAELEAQDPEAAMRLRSVLDDADRLSTAAVESGGPMLDVVGRLLSLLGNHTVGAELLLRWADEADSDRVRAFVDAAMWLRLAGQADRAEALLREVEVDGATNPAVLLLRAGDLDDPEDRLRALDDIDVTTGRDRARAAVIRAEALSILGRDEEAVEDVRAALSERWSPDLAERLAVLLPRSRASRLDDVEPEPTVDETITVLDELVGELLVLGLPDMAMQMDARLVHALLHVSRHDLVAEVATYWRSRASQRDPAARTSLALALLDAVEPDAARAISPDPLPDDVEGRLLGAQLALAEADDAAAAEMAVETLDELLSQGDLLDHQRLAVGQARALAAGEGLAEWSDTAGAILAGQSHFYHDMVRARHLASRGEHRAAEALLLGYTDQPEGVRALIDLAADAEQWDRVVTLVEGLGERAPAVERGRRAAALERLGRRQEAEAAFHEVALAEDASPYYAERAWSRLAELLADRRQWEALAGVAKDWRLHRPDSPLAVWVEADALARTGHAEEAWRVIEEDGGPPATELQRRFVAMLASRALALPDALQRIAALSDAVDRTDEHLEAMLIALSAGSDKAALSRELEERVRLTFADFAERFPESTIVQQFEAPTTEDQLADFAERHLAGRQRVAAQMERSVVTGQSALAVFAVLRGGTALDIWLESDLLPLVAPVGDLQEAELADAAAAIAGPVVWDSSSLAVMSLVDEDVAETVSRALPTSTVPRSVQAEVGELPQFVAARDPARSPGTLAIHQGMPAIVPRTEAQAEALRARVQRVEALAALLTTLDPDLADEGEVVDALRDEDIHGSAASWLAATLLARQRASPLLCDDRYIRAWARGLGLATFGTPALLHAIAQRDLISDEQLRTQLWLLRAAGGRYLPADVEEVNERIARDGYEISEAVDGLLRDPDVWSNPAAESARWQETMVHIWRERPTALYQWTVYIVARVAGTLGLSRPAVASMLVLSGLTREDRDIEYLRALLAAMRRCNLQAFTVGDPLVAAFNEIRRPVPGVESEVVQGVVLRALSRLPITEQLRLLGDG